MAITARWWAIPRTGTGEIAQAFSFDGYGNGSYDYDYVSVPDDAALDFGLGDSMTIVAWVKNDSTDGDHHAIVSRYAGGALNYEFGIDSSTILYFNGGGASGGIVYGAGVTPSTWTLVAAVVDAAMSEFRLYQAEPGGSITGATGTRYPAYFDTYAPNSAALLIGWLQDAPRAFEGMIDEVMIFNRALSATELDAILMADTGGLCKMTLTKAVSRKTHSSIGVPCLEGDIGLYNVEPRRNGPNKIVFTFSRDVFATDGNPNDGTEFTIANASFGSASISGKELTLNLTNVTDASTVAVDFSGLEDTDGNAVAGDTHVECLALYGDVTLDGTVDATDVSEVTSRLGHDLNTYPLEFPYDVNPDCIINNKDIPLLLAGAVSRKTHGAAGTEDLALTSDPDGSGTVEMRDGGPTRIIFTFNRAVKAGDGTFMDGNEFIFSGTAMFSSAHLDPTNRKLTLILTGVGDEQALGIALEDIVTNDLNAFPLVGDKKVEIRCLVGDVNGDRIVNSIDRAEILCCHGPVIDGGTNFKLDLNLNGNIGRPDESIVRLNLGHTVP